MGRFISGLFSGNGKQVAPAALGARINTSLQGVPIPFLLGGQVRQGGNYIDYFGFQALTAAQAGQGGKGGIAGAGGGKGQQGQYVYSASFLLAVAAGPLAGFSTIFTNGAQDDVAGETGDFFFGGYTQLPWGGTEAEEPSHALAYRGLAYVAWAEYVLGSSPTLPNFTATISSSNNDFLPGQPDGDPTQALTIYLTDPFNGLQFPSFRLGTLAGTPSSWQAYCKALGLAVSQIITSQVTGSAPVTDLLTATNSEAVWQDGQLTVIPYGDTAIAQGQVSQISEPYTVPAVATGSNSFIQVGNFATFVADKGVSYVGGDALTSVDTYPTSPGTYFYAGDGVYWFTWQDNNASIAINYTWAATASYTPNTASVYDFTLDDYLPNQGTIGQGLSGNSSPLAVVRKSRDLIYNDVKVEYLDRSNNYNPVVIERKASAEIVRFGRQRTADTKQLHLFALASAAVQSCQLQLIRQQAVPRTYQWTVGGHFILVLGIMDVCTHTLAARNMLRRPVRVTEIQENQDGSLTYTGEDFPGTVSAPIYGTQASSGFGLNFNVDPGAINPPIIFEPTDELAATFSGVPNGGLCIAVAVSGQNTSLYRGCNVLASYSPDGPFTLVGTIDTPSRMGVLTAPLPAIAVSATGRTIDQTNTLSIDLGQSASTLDSGTVLDATSLNTRCIVGGEEVIAYETATLVSGNAYNLTYLVRGGYGTEDEIAAWPTGASFARLDSGVVAFPYDQSRIGAKVYLKFQAFNLYGGGAQDVSTLGAYTYTITGSALASPLPNIQNLTTKFVDGRLCATWDEIQDFRGAIRTEIREGDTFQGALTLGTVAHPPFVLPGNGTFWFTGWCQPTAGLIVRSEAPQSLDVTGATLDVNVVATFDCGAAGWPGTFGAGTGVDTGLHAVRTGGAGNILTDPNILAESDVIDLGGQQSGTYTPAFVVDVGRVAPVTITISFKGTGVPVGQNILTEGNVLTDADVLGSANSAFVDVSAFVLVSQTGTGSILAESNVLTDPSILQSGIPFGPQKYSPGDYVGRLFGFQFNLDTLDPGTIAYLLSAVITVSVPARIDSNATISGVLTSLTNLTLPAGGATLVFTPDGATAPAAFNGGPGNAVGSLPQIIASWGDEQAGDVLVISAESLSQVTIQIQNGGVGVQRTKVNIFPRGY